MKPILSHQRCAAHWQRISGRCSCSWRFRGRHTVHLAAHPPERRQPARSQLARECIQGVGYREDPLDSIFADKSLGGYRVLQAEGRLSEPEWPANKTLGELLEIAFGDRIIMAEDHPVVRRLRGLGDGAAFREIWACDFENRAAPGERPSPLCMCARAGANSRGVGHWQRCQNRRVAAL